MKITAVVVVILLSSTAAAADPPACAKFLSAIDHLEKTLSSTAAKSTIEDSAPRATVATLEGIEAVLMIQLNLNLAIQNKCAQLPSHPVQTGSYLIAALECENAMLRLRAQGRKYDALPEVCKMEAWKPTSGDPPDVQPPGMAAPGEMHLKSLEGFQPRR